MSAPSPFFFCLGLAAAASACAAAVSLDGLVSNSPFMLKQSVSVVRTPTENSSLEFRGMITTKEGVLFGFFDRAKNSSAWVRQNDQGGDYVVRAYDAGSDLVTVDYQGQVFSLPLSMSKIGAAAHSVPVVNAPGTMAGGNAIASNAASGAKVADQTRLESVASEVRRRRALRQAVPANPSAAGQPTGGGR